MPPTQHNHHCHLHHRSA